MKNLNLQSSKKGISISPDKDSEKIAKNGREKGDSIKDTKKKEEVIHTHRVELTWRSILMVLAVIAAVYFSIRLLTLVTIIFFAFVLSSALIPTVRWFMRKGLPKYLSIGIVYTIAILFFVLAAILVVIPMAQELGHISQSLPEIRDSIVTDVTNLISLVVDVEKPVIRENISEIFNELISRDFLFSDRALNGGALSTIETLSDLGTILGSVFLSVVLSIYIIADNDTFIDILFLRIQDEHKRKFARNLIKDLESRLGSWLLGQGTLSLIVGVIVWVILMLFDVPFALPLALFAAIMETIPNGGPVIAYIPILIITLVSNGFVNAFLLSTVYTLFFQIENAYLVPKVMGNVIGVKPVVVFVGVMVGLSVAGILGAILAVPMMVLLKIAYDFYLRYQKLKAEGKI
jgi:predicted PurR-regulated permease PerM